MIEETSVDSIVFSVVNTLLFFKAIQATLPTSKMTTTVIQLKTKDSLNVAKRAFPNTTIITAAIETN